VKWNISVTIGKKKSIEIPGVAASEIGLGTVNKWLFTKMKFLENYAIEGDSPVCFVNNKFVSQTRYTHLLFVGVK